MYMGKAIDDVRNFQRFLSTLKKDSGLFRIKTIEDDLKEKLNPTDCLDDLFFQQNRWVNFEDFYEYYLSKYLPQLRILYPKMAESELKLGIKARLYRTQFGILTEYHAYYASRCIFGIGNVYRHKLNDKIGVDYSITLGSHIYHVHVFVETDRAWKYRSFKHNNKNGDHLPGIHVDLPYSLKKGRFNSVSYLPNGFGIYTSCYLKYFKQEIISGNIQNGNILSTTKEGFIYA